MRSMGTLKAEVQDGRAVVTDLDEYPDGTVIELVVVDTGDSMSAVELEELDTRVAQSRRELEAGQGLSREELIRTLRSK